MKKFKAERDWKDLERADKIAIIVGVLIWAALETGVFVQSQKFAQLKQNVFKSEMVNHR